METSEIERANEGGGSGSARQYNRVRSGEHGGEFATTNTGGPTSSSRNPLGNGGVYTPRPKGGGGGGSKAPTAPSSAKFTTLAPGANNNPEAVAQMQQLLTALGIGNLTSGEYDKATEDAVSEAQRRLGIKPNGKANQALVTKMLAAYDLSPCIKRSEGSDDDTLTRSEADGV